MTKQDWLDIAEAIDALRLVPRLFMALYIFAAFYVGAWYMAMPDPSTQQTTFAGLLGSTLGVVTAWYYQTGRNWQQK